MSMLLVDAGNSRIKWGFAVDGEIEYVAAAARSGDQIPEAVDTIWQACLPTRVVVSNVAGQSFANELTAWSLRQWGVSPEFVATERNAYGVETRYADFTRLGVDRWVALVGAVESAPVCVVDCGTAATLDFLDANGVHQGGMILPGLSLMRESLFQRAPGIRNGFSEYEASDNNVYFGTDTQSGIELGTLHAVVGGIEHAVEKWVQETGLFKKIITGGDATVIQSALKEEYHRVPDLVLRGLHRIAHEIR